MIETAVLALSYPLRLMATWLAVGCLKLFGVVVEADRTLITVGERGIAVTDACSGIEQLGALVLVGAGFAWMMQRTAGYRLLHLATILPSVVLANAFRLVVTVVLFRLLGETVLGDAWHHALGYAQTVLALVFVWAFGAVIRSASRT